MADEVKPQPEIRNIQVKGVKQKKITKLGEIAHYHKREDETKTWEEACHNVEYIVRDKRGFSINGGPRYVGKVLVPQCIADQLVYMDVTKKNNEEGIYRGGTKSKVIGAY